MKSISIKYIYNIIIYCIHIHKRFFTMRFKPHVYTDRGLSIPSSNEI